MDATIYCDPSAPAAIARSRAPARAVPVARDLAENDQWYAETRVRMDTFVTIQVADLPGTGDAVSAVERAFRWFDEVEAACSRFEPTSEVMQLGCQIGVPVTVSPLLFAVVRFALAVARASHGAFDPTVGGVLEARGFDRSYRTGVPIASGPARLGGSSYRDVQLHPERRAITLRRPLVLDLGAVAKGFAIDLAARELARCPGFAIDAGGDLYLRGPGPRGDRWSIGIPNPRTPGALIDVVQVRDVAVCTSGDYARVAPRAAGGHHLVDARTGHSLDTIASVTVIAPTAMAADALGTAAFVLGWTEGRHFLVDQGVDGLIVSATLERQTTPGWKRYRR